MASSFTQSGRRSRDWLAALVIAATAGVVAGCGGDDTPAAATLLTCDDGMKTAFKPDTQTQVVLCQGVQAG